LAARVSVETRPDVVRELAHPLAGDRRAGFFAARPGRVGALRSALTPILPEGAKVIDMNDAVEAGLFGPPPFHVELEQRLGDLLVLVPSPAALTYLVPGAAVPSRYLIGAHGGLDPADLIVPLVSSSLDDLGTERRESKSGPPKR
ncbi:MAG: hypothetical protein L3J91_05280, partial [Thermoplasmata archaeon]|nr:hypothetical protein [Thermoplasmata archaeon]